MKKKEKKSYKNSTATLDDATGGKLPFATSMRAFRDLLHNESNRDG